MDDIDVKIVDMLQQNARISNAEISRRVNMAPSAVLERIKKLEERRVIREYGARLDPAAVGLGLLAFVAVKADYCEDDDTGRMLAAIPGVLEVHNVAGDDCYLVKVRTRDTEHLGRLLREQFRNIPAIRSTKTTIVLASVKETNSLPLPE
ncbi:Lrp/AsnC family transcriptional regulator [Anaeroselena agilis]|uniref:Lrp/AsnC family transcriptional regulator n=1 Tax=Anaeroselena agilis TaxID=3063788 RepID=A0ABU3NVF2_9FIRM|nr:Lrp/AsnC family transcriptional regulator [Selenomonadales bacterium 4137-cl]